MGIAHFGGMDPLRRRSSRVVTGGVLRSLEEPLKVFPVFIRATPHFGLKLVKVGWISLGSRIVVD